MTRDEIILLHLTCGQTVLIAGFDDVPEHP